MRPSELQNQGSKSDNYKQWFGTPDRKRLSTVSSHFRALKNNNFGDFKYVCNTQYCAQNPNVYAYVYAKKYVARLPRRGAQVISSTDLVFLRFGQVHVCDAFFRAPVGGRNSRASTIVHEVRSPRARPLCPALPTLIPLALDRRATSNATGARRTTCTAPGNARNSRATSPSSRS